MKILHICNDFCGSKVHANLYAELDKHGLQQTIYSYFCDASLEGENKFEAKNTTFLYRRILNKLHRLLFHKKVHDVYADLKSILSADISSYDLIHATTLFSDGALALRLYKEYRIPFVVTVRSTDVNEFLGYAPHTWLMGLEVLKEARRIIFISKALENKFCRHPLIKRYLNRIQNKFVIQPNGVDSFWLDHLKEEPALENRHVIYVGRFDRNKNVLRLCNSILELRDVFPDIQLHLVGGGGSKESAVLRMVHQYPDTITYHGKISDKAVLKDVYSKSSVFAMPSYHETFGLVYLEAFSQHLALVYTKNQGVDGMLDKRVGESVKASSKADIKRALRKIFLHRSDYLAKEVVDFSQFSWEAIASRYVNIYDGILAESGK